ncbi:hypothetical protein ACFU8T_07705 [Sphingobacterium spiritivorum]|uniref:Uncharacterized protein n=1 Tax=Sphingobacterium spiritivorum ATCC 33861 TaxID=525373 RepID=D7VTE2_SPHSI|nr:hypothetical protein [Sphingobacterium spiritivorum]EFK57043.1 hypothetical protein HMPREF0766_14246 [Sphingobacterium spiritivorum ATCC 33861]QQT34952.1 hypothetical protein I6J01_16875 [Sphingobacterium spiritivorum]WQD35847.1 hypothetical protein U0038_08820 [Sphingobacterium spiritivorum]SUJ02829.1 Uncharacterised protein [Sphingobacterium spiritivorum]
MSIYQNNDCFGRNIVKSYAVTQEVEASFKFIESGILNLQAQKFAVLNNHVTLQLLAAGFERLLKILLLLKEKELNGDFPELELAKKQFNKYNGGHGIGKMLDELLEYSEGVEEMKNIPMIEEDIRFLKEDEKFTILIDILTEFAISQRYFYIDTIVLNKENTASNPFEKFTSFVYSFNKNIDTDNLSYEEEDKLAIKNSIICIEMGVRAISSFFTHGLGDLGRQYYGDFSSFILLKEKDLGSLDYTKSRVAPHELYVPMSKYSLKFLGLKMDSKSKLIVSSEYEDWPFSVGSIKVYFTGSRYYFAEIGNKIFALTGATSRDYEIPTYFKSKKLKPKGYALFLLEEAKKLNPKEPL